MEESRAAGGGAAVHRHAGDGYQRTGGHALCGQPQVHGGLVLSAVGREPGQECNP